MISLNVTDKVTYDNNNNTFVITIDGHGRPCGSRSQTCSVIGRVGRVEKKRNVRVAVRHRLLTDGGANGPEDRVT